MKTTQDDTKFRLLTSVLHHIHSGKIEDAKQHLSELLQKHLNVEQQAEDLLYYVFASALSKRFANDLQNQNNLYLKQYELSQITLFNLLAKHHHIVATSSHLSNLHLARAIEGQDDVTLLNIGIGTGRQEVALLQLLQQQDNLPKKLTVHAIEPFTDALKAAEQAVGDACKAAGVELVFHPHLGVVEQLADEDWLTFVPQTGCLLVNASFALHHIRGQGDETGLRQSVFHKIRKLNPTAVVICEPHSDHYNPDLLQRFENCWNHFALVFDFIDQLGLEKEEVIALKMFFSREIEDILGNQEENRYERHERAEAWVERMRNAGFALYDDLAILEQVNAAHVGLTMQDGYIGVDYKGETLVAVFCGTV